MKENKGNPVAKYMRKFNKATVQTDRKKAMKKGDRKHKGRYEEVSEKTFEPHMMYHPKTGDEVKAKTHQQHLDLKGKGYVHEKPSVSEAKTAHINLDDNGGARQDKILKILKKYEKKGSIKFAGETDKGVLFDVKKPSDQTSINRELKAVGGGYHLGESLDAAQKEKKSANLKLKHANQRVQLTKRHEKEKETLSTESMDPRDYTDKAGYVVVVTGRRGKQSIKNFFSTKPAAQKYADKVNKINKVGNKATVHKTDGRKLMKEDTNESTSAYKKSLAKIADKKKRAGMSSSDQNKMGRLSALMKRQKKEEVEQIDELSKDALSRALEGRVAQLKKNKDQEDKLWDKIIAAEKKGDKVAYKKLMKDDDKLGDEREKIRKSIRILQNKIQWGKDVIASPNVRFRKTYGEEVEQVDEATAPSTVKHKGKTYYQTGKKGKDMKTGHPSFEYSSDMDGDDGRVWYNTRTKQLKMESKGGKMTQEETVVEATSQKLLNKMKELGGGQLPRSSVELRKLKAKAQDELRGARAAKKAEPKKVSKTSKGKTHTGSGDPADRNIIMQLRKAQDALSPGKFDIRVSPTGKTVNLPKEKIDALLKKHDTIQKPRDKRMFNVQLTKALRKLSK
jgi:hypothetical protein